VVPVPEPSTEQAEIDIGVVDDHPVIIVGVLAALATLLPHARARVSATTVEELLAWGEHLDIVVLDLHLGDGSDPADNVARVVAAGLPVLIFTQEDHLRPLIARCFRAGARGIVTKHEDVTVLAAAISVVAAGGTHFSPSWAAALEDAADAPLTELAPREAEALRLYATGIPLKSVARRMGVAEDTAKEYIDRARRKYLDAGRAASTKVDLYVAAVQDGLLDFPPSP
jgi:DNA-binding NarL/FixJ family response regulator